MTWAPAWYPRIGPRFAVGDLDEAVTGQLTGGLAACDATAPADSLPNRLWS